ncbi:hypothetical protein IQ07DRAFT_27381 [Pyrenochaeta sp. DS3sAY3a]|nr:hypothetical protein IQ07DRAFT_27381 [Pyrenochaeta sp. DS3sAY3a]
MDLSACFQIASVSNPVNHAPRLFTPSLHKRQCFLSISHAASARVFTLLESLALAGAWAEICTLWPGACSPSTHLHFFTLTILTVTFLLGCLALATFTSQSPCTIKASKFVELSLFPSLYLPFLFSRDYSLLCLRLASGRLYLVVPSRTCITSLPRHLHSPAPHCATPDNI